jgi:protein TonB
VHPVHLRARQRDHVSSLPGMLCVVAAHASLIAWMPALGPRAAASPEPIAVRFVESEPLPTAPVVPERPAVPLPAAAFASSRAAPTPPRRAGTPADTSVVPLPALDRSSEPTPEAPGASTATAVAERPVDVVPAAGHAASALAIEGTGAASIAQQRGPSEPVPGRMPGEASAALVPARHDADYLRNPAPVYPTTSRRLRESGEVLLRVEVTADGEARMVEIERGSGHARLDEAARRAVAGWRFIPARRGDAAVGSRVLVPIVFRLDD